MAKICYLHAPQAFQYCHPWIHCPRRSPSATAPLRQLLSILSPQLTTTSVGQNNTSAMKLLLFALLLTVGVSRAQNNVSVTTTTTSTSTTVTTARQPPAVVTPPIVITTTVVKQVVTPTLATPPAELKVKPEKLGPIVSTKSGQLRPSVLTSRGGREYFAFKGVPFANPPVQFQRFKVQWKIRPRI